MILLCFKSCALLISTSSRANARQVGAFDSSSAQRNFPKEEVELSNVYPRHGDEILVARCARALVRIFFNDLPNKNLFLFYTNVPFTASLLHMCNVALQQFYILLASSL